MQQDHIRNKRIRSTTAAAVPFLPHLLLCPLDLPLVSPGHAGHRRPGRHATAASVVARTPCPCLAERKSALGQQATGCRGGLAVDPPCRPRDLNAPMHPHRHRARTHTQTHTQAQIKHAHTKTHAHTAGTHTFKMVFNLIGLLAEKVM